MHQGRKIFYILMAQELENIQMEESKRPTLMELPRQALNKIDKTYFIF
jgi:hypothetical protein